MASHGLPQPPPRELFCIVFSFCLFSTPLTSSILRTSLPTMRKWPFYDGFAEPVPQKVIEKLHLFKIFQHRKTTPFQDFWIYWPQRAGEDRRISVKVCRVTPLRQEKTFDTIHTEPVKRFISSRTVLPTRNGVLGRKAWDLFFFTVRQ